MRVRWLFLRRAPCARGSELLAVSYMVGVLGVFATVTRSEVARRHVVGAVDGRFRGLDTRGATRRSSEEQCCGDDGDDAHWRAPLRRRCRWGLQEVSQVRLRAGGGSFTAKFPRFLLRSVKLARTPRNLREPRSSARGGPREAPGRASEDRWQRKELAPPLRGARQRGRVRPRGGPS